MTTILLIRHGQSEANLTQVFAGQKDVPLTANGRMQAEQTAAWLSDSFSIDRVYASDLQCAFQTGKALADRLGVPCIPEPGMREIHAGAWEGVAFDTLQTVYGDQYHTWLTDIGHAVCPDGESVAELSERVTATVLRLARENEGRTIAIATPIRALQCHCEGKSLAQMQDIPWVSNASVTTAVYQDGRLTMTEIGHDRHLGVLRTNLPANV